MSGERVLIDTWVLWKLHRSELPVYGKPQRSASEYLVTWDAYVNFLYAALSTTDQSSPTVTARAIDEIRDSLGTAIGWVASYLDLARLSEVNEIPIGLAPLKSSYGADVVQLMRSGLTSLEAVSYVTAVSEELTFLGSEQFTSDAMRSTLAATPELKYFLLGPSSFST